MKRLVKSWSPTYKVAGTRHLRKSFTSSSRRRELRPASPAEMPGPYLVREAAPALIYARLAGVRAFDAILPQATLEQFHALRIEFKSCVTRWNISGKCSERM